MCKYFIHFLRNPRKYELYNTHRWYLPNITKRMQWRCVAKNLLNITKHSRVV